MNGNECNLPEAVIFTDGSLLRAEHGMYLHGFTPAGDHFSVQVRQSNIPDLEHAGRLFVNDSLVALRSDQEKQLLQLLAQAEFAEEPPANAKFVVDFTPGPIMTVDGLQTIRDAIDTYVRSDKYADIATNGVPAAAVPWQPWVPPAKERAADETTGDTNQVRRQRKRAQPRTFAIWLSAVIAVVVAAFLLNGMHRLQKLSGQLSRGMPRSQVEEILGEPYLTLQGANGSGELLVWTDIYWQVDVKLDGDDRVLRWRCVPANSWLRNAQSKLSSP